jgi:hypothetical protein
MAKTAYVYPQPTLKPVAAPVAAPASNDSTQPASRPVTDPVTVAKYVLATRISHFVRTDPALASDWLALVALCQATRPASQEAQGAQVILSMAVDDSGRSDVFGLETADGGVGAVFEDFKTWLKQTFSGGGGGSEGGSSWVPDISISHPGPLDFGGAFTQIVTSTNPDGGVVTTSTTSGRLSFGGPTTVEIHPGGGRGGRPDGGQPDGGL